MAAPYLTIAARRRKFSLCRDTKVVSLTGSDISDIFKAELTAMASTRVRSGAIALFAAAFFVGGPLLAQAPAATDVRPEVSKFQDIELRLVRFRINGKEIVIPSTVTITLTFQKGGQIS